MDKPPWLLSDAEWEAIRPLLETSETINPEPRRGRRRLQDVRPSVEACLFRYFHCLSRGRNKTFNWNALPDSFGVSPATANRRFREWHESGAFPRLWAKLLKLRSPRSRSRPRRHRIQTPYPATDLVLELQRAYRFFNEVLFGNVLPEGLAIIIQLGRPRDRRLGLYCGRSWQWGVEGPADTIAIASHAIAGGPDVALETLIHEMVHHRNDRCGLGDCSNGGIYHNRYFRDAAILAGLCCPAACDKNYGYGFTSLGKRARWAIARLKPNAMLFHRAEPLARPSHPAADHPRRSNPRRPGDGPSTYP